MTGWLKLYRAILNWGWYKDSQMVHLFIHILVTANHEDKEWFGLHIKRGQLVTGRKALSESTGISERSIRTCLNKLKSTGEVTIKSTNQYSVITVCNYDKYQVSKSETDQQTDQQTDQRPTSDRPATDHKQEVKELKNKRSKVPPSTEEVKNYCVENNISVDAQAFFDYYESNGWKVGKNPMKDWQAAVRNWKRNGFSNSQKTLNLNHEPQRTIQNLTGVIPN